MTQGRVGSRVTAPTGGGSCIHAVVMGTQKGLPTRVGGLEIKKIPEIGEKRFITVQQNCQRLYAVTVEIISLL